MSNLNTDINKFSFAQLCNNNDGKTSASGTGGLYIIFIGGICFLMGCIERMFIDQSIDVITQSIIFVSLGVGLLGYRKSVTVKNGNNFSSIGDGKTDTTTNITIPGTPEAPVNATGLNQLLHS